MIEIHLHCLECHSPAGAPFGAFYSFVEAEKACAAHMAETHPADPRDAVIRDLVGLVETIMDTEPTPNSIHPEWTDGMRANHTLMRVSLAKLLPGIRAKAVAAGVKL